MVQFLPLEGNDHQDGASSEYAKFENKTIDSKNDFIFSPMRAKSIAQNKTK